MVYRNWTNVFRFHYFSSFICVITFCELTPYAFHFFRLIQTDQPERKYKRRFYSERPYISESETEYTVPKFESHVRVSKICLSRLILSKISFHFQYIFHQTLIFIFEFVYRLKYRDSVIKIEASYPKRHCLN
jgi:hypothetical protein